MAFRVLSSALPVLLLLVIPLLQAEIFPIPTVRFAQNTGQYDPDILFGRGDIYYLPESVAGPDVQVDARTPSGVVAGKVIGDCYKRHSHQGFLKFLRRINREFPGKVPPHLVTDNYDTHGTPAVKGRLSRHPRFKVHYIPTSSSWLNLIERWFGELTNKRIRRDSFLSVDDLVAAINEFLVAWNENPKPGCASQK